MSPSAVHDFLYNELTFRYLRNCYIDHLVLTISASELPMVLPVVKGVKFLKLKVSPNAHFAWDSLPNVASCERVSYTGQRSSLPVSLPRILILRYKRICTR